MRVPRGTLYMRIGERSQMVEKNVLGVHGKYQTFCPITVISLVIHLHYPSPCLKMLPPWAKSSQRSRGFASLTCKRMEVGMMKRHLLCMALASCFGVAFGRTVAARYEAS